MNEESLQSDNIDYDVDKWNFLSEIGGQDETSDLLLSEHIQHQLYFCVSGTLDSIRHFVYKILIFSIMQRIIYIAVCGAEMIKLVHI